MEKNKEGSCKTPAVKGDSKRQENKDSSTYFNVTTLKQADLRLNGKMRLRCACGGRLQAMRESLRKEPSRLRFPVVILRCVECGQTVEFALRGAPENLRAIELAKACGGAD
ncbi:MAG: hypothetical protein ABII71_05315 [Candidatus Micrarchaeota archaeon]